MASALAGGDCIDDADVLRRGGTAGAIGCVVKAPSTLGTFLRSFRWGHVRQLDRVSRELLSRAWAAGAGPGEGPLTIDLVLVPDIFDKDKKQVSLMYDPMRRIYEDMPALKYKVELNETARTHLKQIASRGEASARKVKRALVLLKADEGLPDRDIASGLLISASTVGRVRTRFVKEGLDSALNERPRPGQKRKLDGRQEAHLIAVACSDAPEGHADWTLQLLADKVVAMGFAESISLETVRQMLKKTSSSRGRRRSGVSRR